MKDLKVVQQSSNKFDISITDGLLDLVEGIELKEQILKLLVYSTWKESIGYGVHLQEFRGMKYLELVKNVVGDRIARSIAFINYFYPDECKLGQLRSFNIKLLANDELKIEVVLGDSQKVLV